MENREIRKMEVKTLHRIWNDQQRMMGLPRNRVIALRMVIEKIFNPSKKRSSLLQMTNSMPVVVDFPEEDVKNLERFGYVISIPTALGNRLTITPEGIIAIDVFEKDVCTVEALKGIAYDSYRKHCLHKINRLRRKEELLPKHAAVILFFLLNGSIGEGKAYQVRSYEDSLYLERIVRSYVTEEYAEVEENYALKYFLVEAKRILGNVAVNRKPYYYLREETLDYVLDSIHRHIKKDGVFRARWIRLKGKYKENITFLRMRRNSHYTTSWEMELDRRFLEEL